MRLPVGNRYSLYCSIIEPFNIVSFLDIIQMLRWATQAKVNQTQTITKRILYLIRFIGRQCRSCIHPVKTNNRKWALLVLGAWMHCQPRQRIAFARLRRNHHSVEGRVMRFGAKFKYQNRRKDGAAHTVICSDDSWPKTNSSK